MKLTYIYIHTYINTEYYQITHLNSKEHSRRILTIQQNAHSPAVQLLSLLWAESGPALHCLRAELGPLPSGGAVHVVNVENAAMTVHPCLPTCTPHIVCINTMTHQQNDTRPKSGMVHAIKTWHADQIPLQTHKHNYELLWKGKTAWLESDLSPLLAVLIGWVTKS